MEFRDGVRGLGFSDLGLLVLAFMSWTPWKLVIGVIPKPSKYVK